MNDLESYEAEGSFLELFLVVAGYLVVFMVLSWVIVQVAEGM